MKIFIGLKNLQAELPGLTILDVFLSVSLMRKSGTYLDTHIQSANLAKVRAPITRMQTYCKAYDPKCFL